VASPISAEPARRPRPAPAPEADYDDRDDRDRDDYDEDRPRRRKKKKQASKGLIIGLAIGGGVLLIGLAIGAYFLFFRGGLSSDELKFLPDKCVVVGSFKPAEFLDSGIWRDMKKEMGGGGMLDFEKQMEDKIGFAPKDIERVTMGGSEDDAVVIVKTRKTVKASDVQKALKQLPKFGAAEFKESKVGSYTISKTEDDEGPAFCIVNSNLVVASEKAKSLEKILKRDKKVEFSSSFQKIVDKADFSKTLAFAVDLKAAQGGGLNALNQFGGGGGGMMMNPLTMLPGGGDLEGIAGSIKASSGIDISMSGFFKDAKAAEAMKKKIDDGLDSARKAIKEAKGPAAAGAKDAADMINSIKISQSGNVVTGSLSIKKSLFGKRGW
jgi:hypothetical protein